MADLRTFSEGFRTWLEENHSTVKACISPCDYDDCLFILEKAFNDGYERGQESEL